MTKHWYKYADLVRRLLDWSIVVILLLAAGILIQYGLDPTPAGASGPIAKLMGFQAACFFYAIVYTFEALVLAYSKIFGNTKVHKTILLIIFLTHLFTTILSFVLAGITERIWDNLFLVVLSGTAWVWYKLKTEYIEPHQLLKNSRLELPPEHVEDDY